MLCSYQHIFMHYLSIIFSDVQLFISTTIPECETTLTSNAPPHEYSGTFAFNNKEFTMSTKVLIFLIVKPF